MKFILILGVICMAASMAMAQYDDDSNEDGDREARRAPVPYVSRPPSNSCAKVAYGNNFCGGLSDYTNGGCDSFCTQRGYPYSWCRSTYCLCHRGEDQGRECQYL